ncbi:hypothetical protein DFR41_1149 [Pseudacidovorax intermedius]|uniref:Uncharacterized protein n=1 Tax=Pseudacidovorax intermedius TaxID=433924 RepID=A0A370F4Y6_9BURK|nr:hypothetical protein [Pseudacidovorax intermedius]RDI18562.1 hypothetical protein DFR41_1149 [Pseudacidovorax intermedius]
MKLDIRQVFLYAILPALIAGIFTVAPKAYEIFFETQSSLEYYLTTGPQISADGAVQQVISVRVVNSGKKALNSVTAELSVPGATLLAHSIDNKSGLQIDSHRTDNAVSLRLSRALPTESFSVSALVKGTEPLGTPKFFTRSDETLGVTAKATASVLPLRDSIFSALAAGASVLAMALIALRRLPNVFGAERRSAIAYIALATRDDRLAAAIAAAGESLSYMQFADMLLAFGRASNDNALLAAAALRGLVAIDDMANHSKAVAKRNLERLEIGVDQSTLRDRPTFAIRDREDAIAFRDFVDEQFRTARAEGAA